MPKKHNVLRPYAPDYVSADSLAYRLDISRSTLNNRIARNELPKPYSIGGLQRWCWAEVQGFIIAQNRFANEPAPAANLGDEYLEGIERAEAENA